MYLARCLAPHPALRADLSPQKSGARLKAARFSRNELRRIQVAMAKTAKAKPLTDIATLTKAQAKVEHKRLVLELESHDKAYYQDDAPKVSDAEYDALRQRFNAIEARFPDLRTLESLSLKVGAAPARGFAKVRHRVPMLSLDNAFSAEDVRDFVERIRRF